MARQFGKLQYVDNKEVITWEKHYEFICHLQSALLLALREQGRLDAMQYRHAEEKLKQQHRDWAKSMLKKERST